MCRTCRFGTQVCMYYVTLLNPFPHHLHYIFSLILSLPNPPTPCYPSLNPIPQQAPVCDVPLLVSMCSHCSTPTYE